MLKIKAFIPARYLATRFPKKLLQPLGNKTVIGHTYDNTVATKLFCDVVVVTDSHLIQTEIEQRGGTAIMSRAQHESGSDRIAEAVQHDDVDIVVNVQGDEPFVNRTALAALINTFNLDETVQVASLMKQISDHNAIANPNIVKVVTGHTGDALYFSRSPIPYNRYAGAANAAYEHIGVYAFRKNTLLAFTQWQQGSLEQIENLEQLRYLEHGIPIRMVLTDGDFLKIDVPGDLLIAEAHLQKQVK